MDKCIICILHNISYLFIIRAEDTFVTEALTMISSIMIIKSASEYLKN